MAVKKIDRDTLRGYVKEGLSAQEMSKRFGLSSLTSLRTALLHLMNEDKQYYDVEGLCGKVPGMLKVGKQGLRISLKRLKLSVGDEYDLRQDGDNIILSKVG